MHYKNILCTFLLTACIQTFGAQGSDEKPKEAVFTLIHFDSLSKSFKEKADMSWLHGEKEITEIEAGLHIVEQDFHESCALPEPHARNMRFVMRKSLQLFLAKNFESNPEMCAAARTEIAQNSSEEFPFSTGALKIIDRKTKK